MCLASFTCTNLIYVVDFGCVGGHGCHLQLLEHELASWTAEVGGTDRANMLANVFVELADCNWIIEATVKGLFGQQT